MEILDHAKALYTMKEFMTFNEWFSKQKLIAGNTTEIAYDIARKAWDKARIVERKEILDRNFEEWVREDEESDRNDI